ncbi:hypothetical protein VNO77_32335 [Canavalia gladiata]|uniref:Uncharacterized protein n=1 Tax=Canavalia gladiata TaxID=3824 RepID=A0AAN9Q458_CANGL
MAPNKRVDDFTCVISSTLKRKVSLGLLPSAGTIMLIQECSGCILQLLDPFYRFGESVEGDHVAEAYKVSAITERVYMVGASNGVKDVIDAKVDLDGSNEEHLMASGGVEVGADIEREANDQATNTSSEGNVNEMANIVSKCRNLD